MLLAGSAVYTYVLARCGAPIQIPVTIEDVRVTSRASVVAPIRAPGFDCGMQLELPEPQELHVLPVFGQTVNEVAHVLTGSGGEGGGLGGGGDGGGEHAVGSVRVITAPRLGDEPAVFIVKLRELEH